LASIVNIGIRITADPLYQFEFVADVRDIFYWNHDHVFFDADFGVFIGVLMTLVNAIVILSIDDHHPIFFIYIRSKERVTVEMNGQY
jgi:hypothetical protein